MNVFPNKFPHKSGGQKRRVSLAAALVHSPPLLILDEPTVGVDPLLRQSIWHHLVTLTKTERISVIITTHYIEEARQANVVGLMRHGKILAEDSPSELMRIHEQSNLEDVFLKLCVTDSSKRADLLARGNLQKASTSRAPTLEPEHSRARRSDSPLDIGKQSNARAWSNGSRTGAGHLSRIDLVGKRLETEILTRPTLSLVQEEAEASRRRPLAQSGGNIKAAITIHTGTNTIQLNHPARAEASLGFVNEAVEVFSSEDDDESDDERRGRGSKEANALKQLAISTAGEDRRAAATINHQSSSDSISTSTISTTALHPDDHMAIQAMKWAARRSNELSLMNLRFNHASDQLLKLAAHDRHRHKSRAAKSSLVARREGGLQQWWRTLMAVTWKNYVRLRRNPPVLAFQFMLPAIQVILFCLCIGGQPFDVPVAVVNEEQVPKSSLQFLNGLDRNVIRQVKYDNLSSAIEAVRKGSVWGAIHIPDNYSENLHSRLIMGEEVKNETISNGTIRVYPDLTNLHLAMALETTFRETFINFARNSLAELGYDKSLADLPIQVGKPVYGSMNKDGYLEFMAPGVVISISYVMATGLTALAFILERRDGLLERSLVAGVQTNQILLAHAINQIFVMVIQIFLVLGCTFFIFEIPSRGPFVWVVLLILLQGCTGMGFGLLVSAICAEENTAVMMVVGTFYTNLILAGIIWPIEAMPHWLRPLSYAQPQTLPTDTLRHILSRGWGISDAGVLLGFAVTIGWLLIFLLAAGFIFKYSS